MSAYQHLNNPCMSTPAHLHTRTHTHTGTPYYMAPELFHAGGVQSFASDFWSIGCVLFELAHGRPPFYSRSVKELVGQILFQELPTDADAHSSPEFTDFLAKMLDKDPTKRLTWEQIKLHPFLADAVSELGEIPEKSMPAQPIFDALVAKSRANDKHSGESSSSSTSSSSNRCVCACVCVCVLESALGKCSV
jgi:serine/threonine protein kinase